MLAALHRISSDRRTAFQARLKNFYRLDFPKDEGPGRGKFTSPGRGRAAVYGPNEIVQHLFACELLQLGLTPERAVEVVESDGYQVIIATALAVDNLLAGKSDSKSDLLLCLDPLALANIMARKGIEDPSSASLFYATGSALSDVMIGGKMARRRLAIINVTVMLVEVSEILEVQQAIEPKEFLESLLAWAYSFNWGVIENGQVRIFKPNGDR